MARTLEESLPPDGYIPQSYPHNQVGVIDALKVVSVVRNAISNHVIIVTDSETLLDKKKNYCIYWVPVMKEGRYTVLRDAYGHPVKLCLKIQLYPCGKKRLIEELKQKLENPKTSSLVYVPPWIINELNTFGDERLQRLVMTGEMFDELTLLLHSYHNVRYVKNLSGTQRMETHPLEGAVRVDPPLPKPVVGSVGVPRQPTVAHVQRSLVDFLTGDDTEPQTRKNASSRNAALGSMSRFLEKK